MDRDIDITNLTRDDLEAEYRYLQEKCKQLLECSEKDAQRIHELKRSLDTANAAEQYLAQELEQLSGLNNDINTNVPSHKLQSEYDEIRRKYKSLESEFNTMQEDYENLTSEHARLRSQMEQLQKSNERNENAEAQADFDKLTERLQVLEQDNMELLHKLEEQRFECVKQCMLLAEKEKQIEVVQDELLCLQENLRYKREELEEKNNLLESAQEQLCEANAKINMLMSTPENKDRKGNSLFAEVDDQRQTMMKLLTAQKKNYNEMKKTYNESQYEIRRLQRENSAMHTELQACSSIFRNADRTYQNNLNKRIRDLLNEKEELEKKLNRTQEHLKDLATDQGVPWLNTMLDFCKKETSELKTQVYSVRIQNASLEEQVRNLQQDLARWRFESLKSRCLLADRENILKSNKIDFKPHNSVEYDITAEQIQNARPRIVPMETKKPDECTSMKKYVVTSSNLINPKLEQSINSTSNSVISINDSIKSIGKENERFISKVSPNLSSQRSPLSVKSDLNDSNSHVVSPHLQIKSVETINKEHEGEKTIKSLPSILCNKQRDLIADCESEKKVQFDTNGPTVYNLSANLNASELELKSENSIDGADAEKKLSSSTATIKTIRTKSNVLVRRIIVKSKPK